MYENNDINIRNIIYNEYNTKKPNIDKIKYILNNREIINEKDENNENILFFTLNAITDSIWLDDNGLFAESTEDSFKLVQKNVPLIDIQIIEYMLIMGADPNNENIEGYRCINEAVHTYRFDILKLLLDYGAEINFDVYKELDFKIWIKYELEDFIDDNNNAIAISEISKMLEYLKVK